MKIAALALGAAVVLLAAAGNYPDLAQTRKIYLLSMGNGFDQYLANRITRGGRFEVVTDPLIADAVMTDRLGEGFEERLKELIPPPPPPEEEKKEEDDKADANDAASLVAGMAVSRPPQSSFTRGRGNVFLVDVKTKKVIWSFYRRPQNSRPDSLDRLAERVVNRLQDDAKPPKEAATK